MAKIYYNLIKNGKYTIEQIPAKWRDEVQAMLDAEGTEE